MRMLLVLQIIGYIIIGYYYILVITRGIIRICPLLVNVGTNFRGNWTSSCWDIKSFSANVAKNWMWIQSLHNKKKKD